MPAIDKWLNTLITFRILEMFLDYVSLFFKSLKWFLIIHCKYSEMLSNVLLEVNYQTTKYVFNALFIFLIRLIFLESASTCNYFLFSSFCSTIGTTGVVNIFQQYATILIFQVPRRSVNSLCKVYILCLIEKKTNYSDRFTRNVTRNDNSLMRA